MKIVIVSDNHGELSLLQNIYLKEQGASLFLNAGDIEAYPEEIWPYSGVRGNCDGSYYGYPFSFESMTPLGKLHMEHRPISETMMKMLYLDGVRIFIHGHTHCRESSEVAGVKVYCPSSICYPRDGEGPCYLVLDVTENGIKETWKEI